MSKFGKGAGKIAIVTGASAGIGEAILKRMINDGMRVVGFARNFDRMNKLSMQLSNKTGKFYGVKCDVTKVDEIIKGFKWVKDNLGPVHILVNNAATCKPTSIVNGSLEDWKAILDTNILATCICTKEAIKVMQENNISGIFININSVFGHLISKFPGVNLYPATKMAGRVLSETLRQELCYANSKIKIMNVSPGVVDTNFMASNGIKLEGQFKEIYEKEPKLKPEDVADAVMYAIGTPPHVQIQDIIMRAVGENLI